MNEFLLMMDIHRSEYEDIQTHLLAFDDHFLVYMSFLQLLLIIHIQRQYAKNRLRQYVHLLYTVVGSQYSGLSGWVLGLTGQMLTVLKNSFERFFADLRFIEFHRFAVRLKEPHVSFCINAEIHRHFTKHMP